MFFFSSIFLSFSAYFQFCRIFEMAISTKNSKMLYILGHFVKIQTMSDFEKKEFRGKLTLNKNHSSILEIVIFYIFVNLKIKVVTFEKSTRPRRRCCLLFLTFKKAILRGAGAKILFKKI